MLALDLFTSVGFEGPHDFGTVLDKHFFRDNFDSVCDRICDDYHTLILGNDMDFPSHEWENHQLFAWINRIFHKTYGVLIARNNKTLVVDKNRLHCIQRFQLHFISYQEHMKNLGLTETFNLLNMENM